MYKSPAAQHCQGFQEIHSSGNRLSNRIKWFLFKSFKERSSLLKLPSLTAKLYQIATIFINNRTRKFISKSVYSYSIYALSTAKE
jgi:hypothetical protein